MLHTVVDPIWNMFRAPNRAPTCLSSRVPLYLSISLPIQDLRKSSSIKVDSIVNFRVE